MPGPRDVTGLVGARTGFAPGRPVEVASGAIRTPRLFLRPLLPSDRDEFLRMIDSSRVHLAGHAGLFRPGEPDGALFERQLRLAAAGDASGTAMRRVAFLDGRLVGAFNLNTIARGLEPVADANWWVSAEAAGRGLATEGLAAIVAHALADLPAGLGLWSVRAWITRDNGASIRVAAKAGLRRAGDERSYLQTGEHWVMHDLYERRADTPV